MKTCCLVWEIPVIEGARSGETFQKRGIRYQRRVGAHELRTPLTRLQLGTALLRRRSGESKELERIETDAGGLCSRKYQLRRPAVH